MYDPNLGRWLSVDPMGFGAGDANLYRDEGNRPTTETDPTGLFAAPPSYGPTAPTIDIGKSGQGVDRGVLNWKVYVPSAPKGLELYTHVDISWDVRRTTEKDFRSGNYRFWLQGLTAPPDFQFNLSPDHGSHINLNPTMRKPWPSFPNADALDTYLRNAYNLRGTIGRLKLRLDFRGYKDKATETFKPKLTPERPGPFEVPGTTPNSKDPKIQDLRCPNRLQSPFRSLQPWLDRKPAIWDSKPDWQSTVELNVNWDWSGKDFAAKYRIEYAGGSRAGDVPITTK